MSDFRLVDKVWYNFDSLAIVFIKEVYLPSINDFRYRIYASTKYLPDAYEENFELFLQIFHSQEEAEQFINNFMKKSKKD